MPLNTIVRERRKALALTQEQVADSLGVSAPAVNKWEKGASCPDVSLLPALARLLKTDLNTLLCFHEEMPPKEVGLFLNRVYELYHSEGVEAAFSAALEKVREYPTNAELLLSLAALLQGALMSSCLSQEEKQPYDTRLTALYERAAACGGDACAARGRYMLASRAIAAGEHVQAQEALDALPEHNPLDKRSLQAQLWIQEGRYAEAAQLLERRLLSHLQEVQAALCSLVKIAGLEGDEQAAADLARCAQSEAERFGLWGYSAYVVPLERAVSRKDAEDSLSILRDMLAALLRPWDMGDSPICRHIRQKTAGEGFGAQFLPSVLSELESSPAYGFLQDKPEFQRLLGEYRAKC